MLRSKFKGTLLVERQVLPDEAIDAEHLADAHAAGFAKVLGQRRIAQDAENGFGDFLSVVRIVEQTFPSVDEQFRTAATLAYNCGAAVRHGFKWRDGERLRVRRKNSEAGGAIDLEKLGAGNVSMKMDARTQLGRQQGEQKVAHRAAIGRATVFAKDVELGRRLSGSDEQPGFYQRDDPLLGGQRAAEDHPITPAEQLSRGWRRFDGVVKNGARAEREIEDALGHLGRVTADGTGVVRAAQRRTFQPVGGVVDRLVKLGSKISERTVEARDDGNRQMFPGGGPTLIIGHFNHVG